MEWRDEGIVLGTRKHGETSAILEVMTRCHGRHLGLVRGGRSRRQQPVLQAGNRVELVWRARLDEHLGTFQAEALELNAARLFDRAASVHGLQLLAAHVRLLPERDPHERLYDALGLVMTHLEDAGAAGELVVRFEMLLLDELGFGLDLSECAVTGVRDRLAYVSPKSGRAVSRIAAEPWKDRLLELPAFMLHGSGLRARPADLEAAFLLTGHFLGRHVYEPRGLAEPPARWAFRAALGRHHAGRLAGGGESAA
jgi:DNA repair protein RecO (recombination protein O)